MDNQGSQCPPASPPHMYLTPDEGACIILECNSDDPAIEKEVKNKVMKTVREGNLLPYETTGGIFPGVIVVSLCACNIIWLSYSQNITQDIFTKELGKEESDFIRPNTEPPCIY